MRIAACLLGAAAILLTPGTRAVCSPPATAAKATTQPSPWSVELTIPGRLTSLYASPKADFLAYSFQDSADANKTRTVLLDIRTRRTTDLLTLLKDATGTVFSEIASVTFSPDGNYAAVVAENTGRCTALLLSLSDKKVQRLGQADSVGTWWGGDSLYLSIYQEMMLGPIVEVNTATGKTAGTKLAGALLGITGDGKWLLCICDPQNPARPLSSSEFQSGIVYKVARDGQVGGAICPAKEAVTSPQLSDNGRYFARVLPPSASSLVQDVPSVTCKVAPLAGEDSPREFPVRGSLVGVSNRGQAVVLMPVNGNAGIVQVFDMEGKPRTLATAQAATVVGNSVYYVASENSLTCVRRISLDDAK